MHEVVELLKSSVFGALLLDSAVTDLSFNGTMIYYYSSLQGRRAYKQMDKVEALNLMRQIANLTNQLFTYQNPILDVVFDKYRLSAVHPLVGRNESEAVVTFALRVASSDKNLLVNKKTVNDEITSVFHSLLLKKQSIVIAGQTSVGKTEVQKYLLGLLAKDTRVLIIDQGIELAIVKSLHPHLDVTLWRYDNNSKENNLSSLIKVALRFNPDYLVIAEARGKEIIDIYNASLSGHPSIITLHSESEKLVYQRMLAMTDYSFGLSEQRLAALFPSIVFLTKTVTKSGIERKIRNITYYLENEARSIYLYNEKKS